MSKKYEISVTINVQEQGWDTYSSKERNVNFTFKENVPEGRDPTQYLRERVSEEIKRNTANVKYQLSGDAEIEI